MERERLQKLLAAAGIGSRRECEEIILEGRVSVNGQVRSELPVLVDPEQDQIEVDGRLLRGERKVYFLLHKPKGVHCTNYDPQGRVRACDLMRGVRERVFPVGRLDADSTGLLLMTNDGELAQRLTHPKFGVPKTYRAHVAGMIQREDVERLKKGIYLAEGKAQASDAKIIHAARDASVIEITLQEGKNREIRRVLARLGHKVKRLIRIKIGPLSLRNLPDGAYRPLTEAELKSLLKYAHREHASVRGDRPDAAKRGPRRPKPTPKAVATPPAKQVQRRERQVEVRVPRSTSQEGLTIIRRRTRGE